MSSAMAGTVVVDFSHVMAGAKLGEDGKFGIDFDTGHELVHFGLARPHQIDLAHHAFARTNAAGFPILLDIAPSRSRKTREEVVRRIDGSNRPIKIDQQAALHTHTRHVDGTR